MKWEQLAVLDAGADRVRHCDRCRLNVYNFANLTREESVALIEAHAAAGKRLCGALYRRADGTMLTRDCPVGVAAARRWVGRAFSRALAAGLLLSSGALVYAAKQGEAWHPKARYIQPLRTSAEWLKQTVDRWRGRSIAGGWMGDIAFPAPPANVPKAAEQLYYDQTITEYDYR